jgi:CheY-specific phosphatase CheX
MSSGVDQTSERIALLVGQSCIQLFEAYGVALTSSSQAADSTSEDPVLFGVIGFVGKSIKATCLLSAEKRLIEASCPSGNASRDWIAELSNQLLGRLKMRLLGCGVNVILTTPLALSGVRLTALRRSGLWPITFSSDFGPVLIWLELEVAEGFELGVEQAPDVNTGELLLF